VVAHFQAVRTKTIVQIESGLGRSAIGADCSFGNLNASIAVKSHPTQIREPCVGLTLTVDMHDTKERLSLFWIFVLLNYLYADVLALYSFVGSPNSAPHLPQWALLGSAVLMEIPIAMIPACRLLPFRANRLANIIAGGIRTRKRFPDLRSASD
jgi:hypothetical protein